MRALYCIRVCVSRKEKERELIGHAEFAEMIRAEFLSFRDSSCER